MHILKPREGGWYFFTYRGNIPSVVQNVVCCLQIEAFFYFGEWTDRQMNRETHKQQHIRLVHHFVSKVNTAGHLFVDT